MRGIRKRLVALLSSRRFVFRAMLLGLALRVAWAFAAGDVQRFYDSDSYIKIADSLLAGSGFLWGDQRAGRPPLYPLLVAATRFHIFGREFLALYLVQALLSAASIAFFASGARRLLGRTAGGITALLVALDPFLIFYSGTALSETLFVFLLAGLFYAVTLMLLFPRLRVAVLGGLCAGGAFLTRPSVPGVFVLFLLAILIWSAPRWKALKACVVMALVAGLVVIPWGMRNRRVTGHWIWTTVGVGASLYDGVGPQADGSSNMNFLHSMPELASMDEYSRDRYLLDGALDSAFDSPGRVLRLAPVKAWRLWTPVPNSDSFRSTLHIMVSLLAVVPVYMLAFLALLGGILRRRDLFVIAAAPAYFTLVHMVFVGSTRYRVPVMPMVAMAAAALAAGFLLHGVNGLGRFSHLAGHRRKRPFPRRKGKHSKLPFRLTLLIIALSALGGAAGYAYYRQWVANPSNVRALAVEKIGLLFPGKTVRVSAAAFGMIDGLDLRDVEVAEPDGQVIARLDFVHIDFARRSLVRFALVPQHVSAAGLYLDLARSEDGSWNLAFPLAQIAAATGAQQGGAAAEGRLARPFTISLRAAFLSINERRDKYSVSFTVDEATLMADGERLSEWRLTADFGGALLGKWRASARGDLTKGSFETDFGVSGLDLGQGLGNRLPSRARSGYDYFRPSGIADASGEVRFSREYGWDFDVKAALAGCGVVCRPFPARVDGLRGELHFTRDGCRFSDLRGEVLTGLVRISGSTSGYGKLAGADLAISVSGASVCDELKAAVPPAVRSAIEAFALRGVFDAETRVIRATGPNMPLALRADIALRGGSAQFRNFPYPIDGIQGRLLYEDNVLLVDGLSGRRNAAAINCSGRVNNLTKGHETDLKISGRGLPLDATLRDLLPERAGAVWKSLALEGTADADVRVTTRAGEAARVAVDARLREASVLPERFPYPLAGGAGALRYADGALEIEELAFAHGPASLRFDGRADMAGGGFELTAAAGNLSIDGQLLAALPAAAAQPLESLGLTGVFNGSVELRGASEGDLEVTRIEGSLARASFAIPGKPLGVGAARAEFSSHDGAVEVKALEGALFSQNAWPLLPVARFAALAGPASKLAATGVVPVSEEREDMNIKFEAARVLIDEGLVSSLSPRGGDLLAGSGFRGLADVSGMQAFQPESGCTAYRLSLDCLDGGASIGFPLSGIRGRMEVAALCAEAQAQFTLRATLDSLSVAGRQLGHTEFDLARDPSGMRLDLLETRLLGGTLSGNARMEMEGGGWACTTRISSMSLAELIDKGFGFRKEDLTGTVDGYLELVSSTGEYADVIGTADMEVSRGALWEVPAILAVMNVLNLKIPERSKFERAHMHLKFCDDRIVVEEISMSSDPATLFGSGDVGYDGTLDLTFYARPGSIPIVSELAGEVGRNIVVTRVTGQFASPNVSTVPAGPVREILRLFSPWRQEGG